MKRRPWGGKAQKGDTRMSSDRIDELRKTVERYKKALAYLDASTPFTYQKFVETHRIAGIAMSESEMRHKWDMSEMMIEGTEGLRQVLRDSLIDAINTLEPLIGQLARAGTSQQILPTQMTKETNDKAGCSW
ncbi:MAG: hypothetical protein N2483_11305, partial [Burkholderiaceae bacterium]|nr:hypothetical protein [Burkholderiaceae bacterium]